MLFPLRGSVVLKFFHQLPLPKLPKVDLGGLPVVAIAGLTVTGLLLGARQLSWLQPLELMAFDQLVRLQPDAGPDPRLLVVAITEADITRYKLPLSDQLVAQTLQELQKHQPRVIGLDIYRDLPQAPGEAALAQQFQAPNVIVITKIGTADNPLGIPSPPNVPEDRVGFNDVVSDPDGVIRRSLLFGGEGASSFAFQLALTYLSKQNVLPVSDPNDPNRIVWGKENLVPLEAKSGGYQDNDAGGYQLLLNYRSRNIARQVTLSQVLNGQLDTDWVKDKIVLIGNEAPSIKDFFFTPYSAGERENPKMAGVKVHAQMVSHLLDAALGERSLFWFWSEGVEVLWIASWAFIGGGLGWCVGRLVLLGGSSILMVGTLGGICFAIFTHQGWVPLATPLLAATLTSGAVVAYRAQQAQRQQNMVMTLLGQNTSPEVAAALWNSRDDLIKSGKLPGKELTATVMFTDLKNFSTISEQMTPEELLIWLNEYLSAMTQEVQSHQGIVNKFTGDGIMAVFGVPIPRTEPAEIAADARHAVACALAMGDRLQEMNKEWQKKGMPVVQMRAGIFTGPVVVGSLGGKERMEYGVIGDSVNTASRLESCEKERQGSGCRVLIAQETLAHIQGEFEIEQWGWLALKGKQQMVDVYRVLAPLSQPALEGQNNNGAQELLDPKSDIKIKATQAEIG
ncbi:MAG: adenylate/guanylate cyclase domain-containing protein [Leptolyngbyaceae bacterium]|nr:adenylate/guanylate cyclase domain-containing protein [Leptolyngbyaceae bacterium]